ncbi:methyltransferase domain-containing protein [Maribacter halichondriae]|uniref:methyltransferase domain-containing protein n=1 Tax=Maribacter halichondriae TaxID=2980554 RepID=UPI0023592FB0|nr:methyltransferase domain-containing protein [Maribacter sp. Hal144]
MDIIGKALWDYKNGAYSEDITTYSSFGEQDIVPLPYLFRDFQDMPTLEKKALELCQGSILDIGAGSGSHSLYLEKKGFDVTALDSSKGAIDTCKARGITNTAHSGLYEYNDAKHDTLLLLMNGLGLAGKLSELDPFLTHLKSILSPEGQILVDSSDIIYMFDEDEEGGRWLPDNSDYYGEVEFTMEYKNQKSERFWWLYCDFNTLRRAAEANNLHCELVMTGEHYDYLARLTRM